ncbi:MAG: 50S ribosomal protein L31e [Methanosarcinales archaeon Met12]|nr:MAG: 50S ribosomal protein L31e [Methanosarcinales archaeon Met12]
MADGKEQIYTIPLKDTKKVPRWRRSKRAMKEIREYLIRHMKVDPEKLHLDESINKKIWERGSEAPPSKIRIKAMKFEDGVVETEVVK